MELRSMCDLGSRMGSVVDVAKNLSKDLLCKNSSFKTSFVDDVEKPFSKKISRQRYCKKLT